MSDIWSLHGETAVTLATTLGDETSSVIVYSQHRNDTVGGTVCTSNVRTRGTDLLETDTDTTGRFGDARTGHQGIVDTLDTIVLHLHQVAAG